jgi:hypothetical protein
MSQAANPVRVPKKPRRFMVGRYTKTVLGRCVTERERVVFHEGLTYGFYAGMLIWAAIIVICDLMGMRPPPGTCP